MYNALHGIMALNYSDHRTRLEREKRYGHLYRRFTPPGHWRESACVYCGTYSEGQDHIPPLVWMEALGVSYFKENGLLIVLVDCCKECNGALSGRRLLSLQERTQFLLEYYENKYSDVLSNPVWTQGQIDELDGRLRQYIEGFSDYQRGINRKIDILKENCDLRPV